MTKLEKIEKWAKENGYAIERWSLLNAPMELTKHYCVNDKFIACQIIDISAIGISSFITHWDCSRNKQDLETLFIPLNNVKRDEKLLKEYLENETLDKI